MEVVNINLSNIKPYQRNPRNNTKAVEKLSPVQKSSRVHTSIWFPAATCIRQGQCDCMRSYQVCSRKETEIEVCAMCAGYIANGGADPRVSTG